ncbi:MAG: hypothetical protein ABSG63_13960 [Spirochaetia bacterium]
MDEEIDRAARRIGEGLRMHKRLSVTDLYALLGGSQEILARTLASLLIRDMIVFSREKGNLYVMLQGLDGSQDNPQGDAPASRCLSRSL